jgi:dihydrodipicolinate synthase/N-acetylneuraminate lyase
VISATVAPFDDTGERVAFERVPVLVDTLARGGVHGLLTCGTTGEGALLGQRGVSIGRARPPLARLGTSMKL